MHVSRCCSLVFCIYCIIPVVAPAADEVNHLVTLLKSEEPEVRYKAARSLQKLGPTAEPAIPPLIAALNDLGAPTKYDVQYLGPRVRNAASDALASIGRPAVPALIKALRDKDPATRAMAADTLAKLGPVANTSFAELSRTLNDPESWIRDSAVAAIARVGAAPQVVVPLLEQKYRRADKDDYIRVSILESLANADPQATMVIPLLIEALGDSDGDVMAAAARTLGSYKNKARPAVNALNKALTTTKVRWDSYADFGFTVPVRTDVVRALAVIGPSAKVAEPSLFRLMQQDEDQVTRIMSAAALVRISPEKPSARQAMTFLIQTLQDQEKAQAKAAEALGMIGNAAAVAALSETLQAPDESEFGSLRATVAHALGEIGPPARTAVPALRAALREKKEWHFDVRNESALALGKIGPAAKSSIPDLIEASHSDDEHLQEYASEAIRKIKNSARQQNHADDAGEGSSERK